MINISIIMSIYKPDISYLKLSINSILKQTYQNYELIIIIDEADPVTIVQEYLKELESNNKVLLIENNINIGLTKSLNKGINIAKGEYIARIDVDDIWEYSKLQKQLLFLNQNNECALVGSGYREIDSDGLLVPKDRHPFFYTDNNNIIKNFVKCNQFCHSSVLIKAQALNVVGKYNEIYRYSQDYELWARIASKYKVANLNEILVYRRVSENMISIKNEKSQRFYSIRAKILAISILKKSILEYKFLLNDLLVILLPRVITKIIRKLKN
jgi:glycosyltransferase involved in cell wall biosynthesis